MPRAEPPTVLPGQGLGVTSTNDMTRLRRGGRPQTTLQRSNDDGARRR
jgi:hypothetical protein